MSLASLPPIYEKWKKEDFDKLTVEEMERLHAILQNKMYALEIHFEQETVFYSRNREKIQGREKN